MLTANQFKQQGFIHSPNLINVDIANQIYEYTLRNLHKGNMDDGQVAGSPSFYQDAEMSKLHEIIRPTIENLLGLKLFNTFNYYRIYRRGAILRIHKDRRAAEIVVTLNLGQKGNGWEFCLVDFDENRQQFTLAPGDGVIYRGCQLNHWRGKLAAADYVSQVTFCFIDRHGPNTLAIKTELLNHFFKKCRRMLGIGW